MVDTHQQKREQARELARKKIRVELKQQRSALDSSALETAGLSLLANCKQFIDNSKNIAGYQAMMGEIPLHPIFDYCHKNNFVTLLPVMHNQSLMFAPFDSTTTFSTRQFGIQEPNVPKADLLIPDQLDLVLVPLVAFDKTCNRIGMGGGFYDRSFEFRKNLTAPPTLVGVAHTFQQVDDVFAQHWDVALDYVATDTGVITNTTR